MLGVIITGHGAFASGLLQALEQVAGRQTLCMAVDFPEGHSTEALGLRLAAACAHCDDGDGVVFLSDMLGGSPFREAANIALAHPGYEVIAGTNLHNGGGDDAGSPSVGHRGIPRPGAGMRPARHYQPLAPAASFRARVAHRIGNLEKKATGGRSLAALF